jgi:hypothetical protein
MSANIDQPHRIIEQSYHDQIRNTKYNPAQQTYLSSYTEKYKMKMNMSYPDPLEGTLAGVDDRSGNNQIRSVLGEATEIGNGQGFGGERSFGGRDEGYGGMDRTNF